MRLSVSSDKCRARLREVVDESGMSGRSFALKCELPDTYINAILEGRHGLTRKTAICIARAVPEVRVDWLLCQDDIKYVRDAANVKKSQYRLIDFARGLEAIRIERGYTRSEIAEAADVAPYTVAAWEDAQSAPRVTNAAKIADALGVTVEEIFERGRKAK